MEEDEALLFVGISFVDKVQLRGGRVRFLNLVDLLLRSILNGKVGSNELLQ